MAIYFVIPIKPVVKKRPRFGGGKVYTPKITSDFERQVQFFTRRAIKKPFADAVKLEITFTFKRPKKPSRNYPSRGDLDNYLKAVLDGMNKIAFNDDAQVCEVRAKKVWGEVDGIAVKVAQSNSGAL